MHGRHDAHGPAVLGRAGSANDCWKFSAAALQVVDTGGEILHVTPQFWSRIKGGSGDFLGGQWLKLSLSSPAQGARISLQAGN